MTEIAFACFFCAGLTVFSIIADRLRDISRSIDRLNSTEDDDE